MRSFFVAITKDFQNRMKAGTRILWPLGVMALLALGVFKMKQVPSNESVFRVAFPSDRSVSSYEPTRIHISSEYILLENLYSPLIELSDGKGAAPTPVASIADKFFWKENDLHLVIRKGLKTIDGHPITVDDVIFSLKRLVLLSENTHGDFKNLICPNVDLKTIDDDCPGIHKEENTLILKPTAKRDFLIPMLAAIDFAILPKGSVDPKTLKIIDYRNTSGPYYVVKDEGQGKILLKANPNHFHFDEKMPQTIALVPTTGMEREKLIDLFHRGDIDHITTIEILSGDDLEKINPAESFFHSTTSIRTAVAFISDKGRKRLSVKKRLAFAKSLQKSFHDHYSKKGRYRFSRRFFLPLGEGSSSSEEERLLKNLMDSVPRERSGEGIHLGIIKSKENGLEDYIKASQAEMPYLKAERGKGVPAFTKLEDDEMPDYIIVTTDAGFLEDIGLVTYTMNAGFFGLSKEEGKAWLKDYMATDDREERLKKLKKMHFESLSQGLMIPLFTTPYFAVSKKPWKPHLSEIFANNQLWKIKRN